MHVFRNHIRNKLLLLLFFALSVMLITVFWGFSSMKGIMSDYSDEVNQEAIIMSEVAELNVKFKTQVQEWKNTLIRGNDPEQLDKYWGRFNQTAEWIQKHYTYLLQTINDGHPAQQISQNITQLQKEADSAIKAMSQGKEQAEASLSQTKKSQAFVDSLHGTIGHMGNLHREIEQEMVQQLKQTKIINQALANIDQQGERSQQETKLM